MYVHPAFHADRAASLAFAAGRGFGLVSACADGRPIASPLPFLITYSDDGSPRVAFHVARANPLARLAEAGGHWLVSAMGADAYVSPDWYASPEQVPTWLYRIVQLSGPVRVTATENLPEHLDALTTQFESWLAPKTAWTAEAVTPARRKMLMKAIVGIEMSVEVVEGNFKLNQHKSDADHVAISTALGVRTDTASRETAAQMIAMRPHLNYESTASALAPAAHAGELNALTNPLESM